MALGLLAVAAHVFDSVCVAALGVSLSATSLLIIVGTIMQSSRQVGCSDVLLACSCAGVG
jgi:preprotein translocase subunit SecY